MKVLHIFSSKAFAGLERHVEELSFEQSKNNNVLVVGPKKFKSKFRANYHSLDNLGFRFSPFKSSKLEEIFLNFMPDVVNTHGTKPAVLLKKFKNRDFKWVATVHNNKKNVNAYEKADSVIAVSKLAVTNFNRQKKNIYHELNWVDETRFPMYTKKNGEYFCFIGRLEPQKNLETLIKIWKSVEEKLVIVGEGSQEEGLKNLVADLDIAKKIKFIPYTDNVGNILCHSKGQIFCSLKEGSPKSFFESLYCEVPVIATPVGAFPELLDNEFISSDLSYESIKKVIVHWTARPKELLKKQKNLISSIKKNHTIKKASERILKIYES